MRLITIGCNTRRDLFCVKPEPPRFEEAEIADRHIQKDNAAILADHPVRSTDNQFTTVLTFGIHNGL